LKAAPIDPLRRPTPADGDFQLVCKHYGLSDADRQLAAQAFSRDLSGFARAFRSLADEIRAGLSA
jgi:hypothetical protein